MLFKRKNFTGAYSLEKGIFDDMLIHIPMGDFKKLSGENCLILSEEPISAYDTGNNSILFMQGSFFQKNLFFSALGLDYYPIAKDRQGTLHDSMILQRIILNDEFSLLKDLYAEFCGIFYSREKIMLIADRRSSLPIFYTFYNDMLYFSSSPFHLLEITGKSPEIAPEQKHEIELFNNILDSGQVFRDIYFVRPGSLVIYDKNRTLRKIRYIDRYDVRNNLNISTREISYELARLLSRSLELITRGIEQAYVDIDSFESVLCSFIMPFERLSLTLRICCNDDRIGEILRMLELYYKDRLTLMLMEMKTEADENIGIRNENKNININKNGKGGMVFSRFYANCSTSYKEYRSRIKEHIKKTMNITQNYEVDQILREYLLDNADQSMICKIIGNPGNTVNPFQEPYLRDFLRSVDVYIVNNGMVFDLISSSVLFKKLLKPKSIYFLKKFYRSPDKESHSLCFKDISDSLSHAYSKIKYRRVSPGEIESFRLN